MADLFFSLLISITEAKIKQEKHSLEELQCQCHLNNSTLTRLPFGNLEHLNHKESFFRTLLLKGISKLPIRDKEDHWHSDIEALHYAERHFKRLLLHSNIGRYQLDALRLSKLNSQEFLEHLIQKGFASHLIKPRGNTGNIYQIDLLEMNKYDVRSSLHQYGCLILLDKNLKVTSIKVPHGTNDLLKHHADQVLMERPAFPTYSYMKSFYEKIIWKQTCNLAVASLFVHVTLKSNILDSHFYFLGTVLVSYYKHYHHFPSEIKKMLQPFIFNGNRINSRIKNILLSNGGILNRVFGFNHSGLKTYLKDQGLQMTVPSPDLVDDVVPIKKDLIKFWDVFNDFSHRLTKYLDSVGLLTEEVNFFVDEVETKLTGVSNPDDPLWQRLASILTHLIYTVTVWNSLTCTIAPYLMHPKLVQPKIHKKNPSADLITKKGFTQNIYLALLTTMESMPKITEKLWETQSEDPYVQGIWKKLQKDLMKLEINEKKLNPNLIGCSLTL